MFLHSTVTRDENKSVRVLYYDSNELRQVDLEFLHVAPCTQKTQKTIQDSTCFFPGNQRVQETELHQTPEFYSPTTARTILNTKS
jgi:hypothetical protein